MSVSVCSRYKAFFAPTVSLAAAWRHSTTSCEAALSRTRIAWLTTMPLKIGAASEAAPARISTSAPGTKVTALQSGKSPAAAEPSRYTRRAAEMRFTALTT